MRTRACTILVCNLIALSLLAVTGTSSGAGTPPTGVLSYIEIDPLAGAASEGSGRNGAFVEVIHPVNWSEYRKCLATTKPATCATKFPHEWSVTFGTQAKSDLLEERLSRLYNEYSAYTTWRMNSLMNANPDLGIPSYSYTGNCTTPAAPAVKALLTDPYIDAWNGNDDGAIDHQRFCDALTFPVTPAWTYGPCWQLPTNINWPEVWSRYAQTLAYAKTVYRSAYWTGVNAAVDQYMPQALDWDGVYDLGNVAVGTTGGSVIKPIAAPTPNPTQYTTLANNAQSIDPTRGYAYIMNGYPGMGGGAAAILAKTSPATTGVEPPGIPALEALKRNLPTRENIFENQWKWSQSQTVNGTPKARPQGRRGNGTLREMEGVGHATFLRVFARNDLEYSPRKVSLFVQCYVPPFLVITVDVVISNGSAGLAPLKFEETRAHTNWMSVPEGYEIYNVRNLPHNRP